MDRLSRLPNELLLRILSLLLTEDVVATMVLSKRWQPLWMLVPKLVYDDSYRNREYGRFSRFVDRSLILHEARVETLHFKLGQNCGDIGIWNRIAAKRCVRELIIEIDCSSSQTPVKLPRSVYMGCTMLVTLKLDNMALVNVYSSFFFPALKTLSLLSVKYPGDEFVKRLLSNCPVLESLVVKQCSNDNVTIFTAIVPSLKSLVLSETPSRVADDEHGFVIDAPSLECLDIVVHNGGFCAIENNMPKIVKANVDVNYWHPGMILGSIISVKHLYLCLRTSKDVYPVGSVLCCLVHLKICTCETEWLNLLMSLLRDSPNLQVLKIDQCHPLRRREPRPFWNEPSSVPEDLLCSLETLEWVKYEGTEEEKEMAAFILRTGRSLKRVTISSKSTDRDRKLEMLKELSMSSRRSPTCQLAFD